MPTRKLIATLLATPLALLPFSASAEDLAARIALLEQQIAELKALVVDQQAAGESTREELETLRPVRKGTRFGYGGYIQLDAITSRYSEGKPTNDLVDDFLVSSLIPVEPASGDGEAATSTKLHAQSSRFFFTTRTPTAQGSIDTRIELDFMLSPGGDERISNSWNPRLRHAYINWDMGEGRSLLAGQSWSTFFNVGALPDLLDFVGPVSTIFVRQPQVRWTEGNFQFALENPATRIDELSDTGVNRRLDNAETIPDLIARYNGTAGDLSWTLAAMGRQLGYESRLNSGEKLASDDTWGYGLSLAGKWQLANGDMRFMLNQGSALGRYMGLNTFDDGYIDSNGDIDTIAQWGAMLAYQHAWSAQWRSTFALSASAADNPSIGEYATAGQLAKRYESAHANLNWLPHPGLQLGGELIYARKELEDGRSGDLSRLQFAMKYAF
ncbi:DcaP family trimeric outer membrane transporter [Haliea sp.]|uniref:DcaP family trimeric outer membrane transporter n=1 Tax=Haliea sp. TaxID=1932666 RepID=UPI0025C30271|nr:DcaP family trimeric outer membrane transporter [Haliea sp.]|tara:strand:- start:80665 stop:81987 length:1323 start_codon:yes stop_codon:yes gene_type:complete